jgi:phosphohistidine phosphatase
MMEYYLLRHGAAEPRSLTLPDADRALTDKGRRDVRAVVKRAARAIGSGMDAPHLILTSPFRRARETAMVVAELFPGSPVVMTDSLKPTGDFLSLRNQACADPLKTRVFLVGHEPHLSQLAAYLCAATLQIDFKKGALLRIDSESGPKAQGVLKWMLTPKLVRR